MKEKVIFAQANSEEMIKFEEKIAYFLALKILVLLQNIILMLSSNSKNWEFRLRKEP